MMQSRNARIALAVGALAVVIVLFVVLSGGDDNNKSSSTHTTQQSSGTGASGKSGVTGSNGASGKPGEPGSTGASGATTPPGNPPAVITVSGGKPVGGVKKLDYTKGDQIRFEVRSSVSDEIHVHGYDLKKDVLAGGSVSFSFPADLEGVFDVELESRGEQIAELRVKPS
jgi:hypothetical protein